LTVPEALELRPMTEVEFTAYEERSRAQYAAQIVAAGELAPDAAAERAEADFARLLPEGSATPDAHLWTVLRRGEPVGVGWIGLHRHESGIAAWIYDVEVVESHRGQGLGRQLMVALHEEGLRLGAASMGLNVFGHNEPALRLYRSLGYTVTSTTMKLEL
jgi:ribosomal protein S18 acetylase RimI-like enzyme